MAGVFCVGHAVQDFVFRVGELPTRAVKHRAHGFTMVGGGPAATAACAVTRLGGHAWLAARVGNDAAAGLIVAELESYGVDCAHVRRCAGAGSSVSAVLVDNAGERLIVNHLDPALPPAPDWLPSVPGAAGAVLGDVRWPEGSVAMFAKARTAGVPAVLDADVGMPTDDALVRAATHVAFSADGLTQFASMADPLRALIALSAEHAQWMCVTAGEEGVFVAEGGGARQIKGHRVPVVDTLGAGDVWHGAFALSLAEGRDEDHAVRFANAAAALKVQRAGGRQGVPTRSQVEALMMEPAA
jgi:sulfofructose kinase